METPPPQTEWQRILRRHQEGTPIHSNLRRWVEGGSHDDESKVRMIEDIEKHPATAKKIQDSAQSKLRQGRCGVTVTNDTVTLYRVVYGEVNSPSIDTWTSMTASETFAKVAASAKKDGKIIKVVVPVENIFTCIGAHPAFDLRPIEEEFILNGNGAKGTRIISITGR